MQSYVWTQLQFEGFHCWPNAPEEVSFLRDRHRHLFHVKVSWLVSHADRDLEFFIQQKKVRKLIDEKLKDPSTANYSCEHWAEYLYTACGASEVTVSEDGENGATVK